MQKRKPVKYLENYISDQTVKYMHSLFLNSFSMMPNNDDNSTSLNLQFRLNFDSSNGSSHFLLDALLTLIYGKFAL